MIQDQLCNVKDIWFTPQEVGLKKCLPNRMVIGCSRTWKKASKTTHCLPCSLWVNSICWSPVEGPEEDNSSLQPEVWVLCAQFYLFKLPVGGRNSKIILNSAFFLRKVQVCQSWSLMILPHLYEIRDSERMVCEGDGWPSWIDHAFKSFQNFSWRMWCKVVHCMIFTILHGKLFRVVWILPYWQLFGTQYFCCFSTLNTLVFCIIIVQIFPKKL